MKKKILSAWPVSWPSFERELPEYNSTATLNSKQQNSEDLVRKRTIPNERPPLVSEVGAKFS
jgi:hypothetical protein